MANPFRLRIPLTIGGCTLIFVEPDPAERASIKGIWERAESAPVEAAETLEADLEKQLIALVERVTFADGTTAPDDWKEQLAQSELLRHGRGVDALALLFRHREPVRGPTTEGPGGA